MREGLLLFFDEAFDKRSWHGPNLRSATRGLTPELAAWRPAEGRHNIQELIVHAAYWKYVVRRRITGEKRGSFALAGSNFFPRPSDRPGQSLSDDLSLLVREHRELRAVIESLPDERLADGKLIWMIRGAAAHDLYHAGQIQLLRRLGAQRP
jgi:hypothetical protein